MKAVLNRIRISVGRANLCDSCRRDGCRAYMTDVPSDRVVVDVDLAFPAHGPEGMRCDFVLFMPGTDESLLAAPLELKSGDVDASEAADQLRGGATFADRFAPANGETVCRPILFHGARIHEKQRKTLNRAKVVFRGRKLTIKTARCNRPRNLASALEP